MVVYLARDGYYVSFATGTDLTQWDNDQVALIVTETNALDWFISANLRHTKPLTRNINPMTASHYPKRLDIGKILGRVSTNHYLQTGILSFFVLGKCVTAGNGAEITTVLCTTKALSVENSTFHFFVSDGAEAQTEYYIWINKGTGADPTESGTDIEADISGATTATDVAAIIAPLINAKGDVGAGNVAGLITITNAQNGAVIDCSSGEGTDTGYTITITTQGTSTHTITKATGETPFSHAFHFEKEGTTANRRKDVLGPVPNMIEISVSERETTARQTYTGEFSFTGAGGNLAQPTAFTNANLPPLTWFNYKNGSGASEFKYNGGAIDVDIVDVTLRAGWTPPSLFGVYDSTKYPRNGLVRPPFIGEVDLGVRIVDAGNTALDTISDLAHGSYAGDLDFIADFYIGATLYLKYTYDKMYIDPESYEEVFQEEGEWFDGVRFTLKFLNENSSLGIVEKNTKGKTYYEND